MNAEGRHAACRQLQVHDAVQGVDFPLLVLYPSHTPSVPTAFGPYSMDVSPDAPIADGRYPVVLISHGRGGSHLLYRGIASELARHGYIVALPEHPGNNRRDNSLDGTHANLENRPRHGSLSLTAVQHDALLGPCAIAERAAVVGHSIGGYTALAMAGGRAWSREARPVQLQADPRVHALVLLAPATAFFMPAGALQAVTQPILMLSAEHDAYTPPMHAQIVLDGVPERRRVTHRVVAGAGHHAFLSPFPATMQQPGFLPATDPAGFDRAAFHDMLPVEVRTFLDHELKNS